MENYNQNIREDELIITLGVFSGRPNPALNLNMSDAEKLAEMVHGVIGKETIHAPPDAKLGEFYGFFIKVPAALSKQLTLPETMRVYSGVLTEGPEGKQKHWRASKNIEELLTGYALKKGLGETLKHFGVEDPSGQSSAQ